MILLRGKYNTAKVFTDNLEPLARAQIERLLDQPFVSGSQIRIMPDVHAGAGCTIGTTMTIKDQVVPNLVGVDIGCGMAVAVLEQDDLDLARLDRLIHQAIPAGFSVRKTAHPLHSERELQQLRCLPAINAERAGSASARWAAATISSNSTGTTTDDSTWLSIPAAATWANRLPSIIKGKRRAPRPVRGSSGTWPPVKAGCSTTTCMTWP
jgi:RNA-splicing ligase RtcB